MPVQHRFRFISVLASCIFSLAALTGLGACGIKGSLVLPATHSSTAPPQTTVTPSPPAYNAPPSTDKQ